MRRKEYERIEGPSRRRARCKSLFSTLASGISKCVLSTQKKSLSAVPIAEGRLGGNATQRDDRKPGFKKTLRPSAPYLDTELCLPTRDVIQHLRPPYCYSSGFGRTHPSQTCFHLFPRKRLHNGQKTKHPTRGSNSQPSDPLCHL